MLGHDLSLDLSHNGKGDGENCLPNRSPGRIMVGGRKFPNLEV